jgi:hypothetical protein
MPYAYAYAYILPFYYCAIMCFASCLYYAIYLCHLYLPSCASLRAIYIMPFIIYAIYSCLQKKEKKKKERKKKEREKNLVSIL